MRVQDGQMVLSASDLSGHLGCHHRTQLDRGVALGQIKPPPPDPMLAVLKVRGLAHETAYVEALQKERKTQSVDLREVALGADGMEITRRAMRDGADLITQAPLVEGRFRGIADVLLRIATPSPAFSDWSYVVVDTKLASSTRAGTLLQLCLYSRMVAGIQGCMPEEFWVVSPGGFESPERFRTSDYTALARQIEAQLMSAVDGTFLDESGAPEPVNECEICRWWSHCERRRREVDHLAFVAGISRLQRRELEALDVRTLGALAAACVPLDPAPRRGSAESYERVHQQARLQRDSSGRTPLVEFLPAGDADDRVGLARLPEPSAADVFLDLEGDPFVEPAGLEYLFGWVTLQPDGKSCYTARWALNAAGEKAAFEALIDELCKRWDADPGFSVYHFGAYEPSALKRLMGRHATREVELDRLLRGERFVDLHAVVRESLRIGIERYGLKQLESVCGYERQLDLRHASLHKRRFEQALELGVPGEAPEGAGPAVETYNQDDCLSTWQLRDWLEAKRTERITQGKAIARPARGAGEASEEQAKRSAYLQSLMDRLLAGVPAQREARSAEQEGRWLVAHLLEWHRREAKASWWEFFRLAALAPADLRDEKNALVGLEHVSRSQEVSRSGRKQLPVDRYRFAPQDHDVRAGMALYMAPDAEIGTVEAIDPAARIVDVKKRGDSVDVHPDAVFAHDGVPAKPIPAALERLAREVAERGADGSGRFRAARDLLLALPPRLADGGAGVLARPGETARDSAVRLALALREGVLPIQGPPGTGKTYTGARVVCALVRAGQKVGITGPSHKVIRNLLDEVVRAAAEESLPVRVVQKVPEASGAPGGTIREITSSDAFAKALTDGSVDVAAGTVWVWAREDMEARLDTLVIDEAGQLSLANALGAATAARSVLLLGDPQQLEQPIQGSHPPGCERSALEHLLGEHDTVPLERGLLLDTTWRLHPAICAFTSELFYEGRLRAHPGCAGQSLVGPTPFAGAGLWLEWVAHQGNTSSALEEVERIVALVRALVRPGVEWIDFRGEQHPLTHADLRIISPYNAQVAALRAAIPEASQQIGTVDRFQGQEAPVVLYSMTTSSAEEAPRGLEFLFSLHRLNVATSRARCTCIVVASPALLDVECRTPRQMKLVNGLCRYRELARLGGAVDLD